MSKNYPERIETEDIENLDKETLKIAVSYGLARLRCPECGNKQYIGRMDGHNRKMDCEECDYKHTVPF